MVAATALYPFLVGVVLVSAALTGGLAPSFDDPGSMVTFAVVTLVLTGGAHYLLLGALRRLRVTPRPWEFPTVLSAAVLSACAQAMVALALDLMRAVFLPVVCLGLSLLGVAVWTAFRRRHRLGFPLALCLVVAASLLLAGTSWMDVEEEKHQERAGLLRDTADFPLVVAVLDSPDWEPSQMWFHEDPWTAGIRYVPVDPSPELDGFGLILRSNPLEGPHPPAWTPLYEGCDLEGGSRPCERHGDVVIVGSADDVFGSLQARMRIAEGVRATLSTDLPNDKTGAATTEFPDIDMAGLSDYVRPARPGEVEEIVSAITE
ncbi:hypothetical protein AB0M72_15565 [Nocardiopsis dassonvillei]